MPRKAIVDLIEELRSWLPNYDHGPNEFPTVLYRLLASAPGGDELADMGYDPFNMGWKELDLLGQTLVAIQDKRDVEDLIAGLIHDEEEEGVEEARRRNPMAREARGSYVVHVITHGGPPTSHAPSKQFDSIRAARAHGASLDRTVPASAEISIGDRRGNKIEILNRRSGQWHVQPARRR